MSDPNADFARIKAWASRTVPFYREGVFPVITKRTLRIAGARMLSSGRRGKPTHTGGSTGEPITVWHDWQYRVRAIRDTILVGRLNGKEPFEREVKLWGSEADVYNGKPNLVERAMCAAFSRTLMPSFRMSDLTQYQYICDISRVKPVMIWAYVDSIYMLAKKINRWSLQVHQPTVIMCTAGTMHGFMRDEIERAFPLSRVVNQYGCREVSCIASQTRQHSTHLWVLRHTNRVELVDNNDAPITKLGVPGRVVVTNLINRAMPIIRYDTGDIAEAASIEDGQVLYLRSVLGRTNSHLIGKDGSEIHGEYVTHLFYGASWCRRFRVTQTSKTTVLIEYEAPLPPLHTERQRIESGLREVIDCVVEWRRCDVIPPLPSGKYEFVRRTF